MFNFRTIQCLIFQSPKIRTFQDQLEPCLVLVTKILLQVFSIENVQDFRRMLHRLEE